MSTTSVENTTQPSQRIGFFDLSAELRNQIYGLLLLHDGKVGLTRYAVRAGKGRMVERMGIKDRRRCHITNTVPLLLANRQVHKDATPILYGGNAFQCYDPTILSQFSEQIGASILLLRHLTLYATAKTDLHKMLQVVKKATGVQRLGIGWEMRTKLPPERMAKELLGCMRALFKCRGEKYDGSDNVLAILDFPDNDTLKGDARAADAVRAHQYRDAVKAELREGLGWAAVDRARKALQ